MIIFDYPTDSQPPARPMFQVACRHTAAIDEQELFPSLARWKKNPKYPVRIWLIRRDFQMPPVVLNDLLCRGETQPDPHSPRGVKRLDSPLRRLCREAFPRILKFNPDQIGASGLAVAQVTHRHLRG